MITCPKCGKQLADGTKFYGGCGTPVSGIQTGGNTGSGNPAGGMQAGVLPTQKSGKKILRVLCKGWRKETPHGDSVRRFFA